MVFKQHYIRTYRNLLLIGDDVICLTILFFSILFFTDKFHTRNATSRSFSTAFSKIQQKWYFWAKTKMFLLLYHFYLWEEAYFICCAIAIWSYLFLFLSTSAKIIDSFGLLMAEITLFWRNAPMGQSENDHCAKEERPGGIFSTNYFISEPSSKHWTSVSQYITAWKELEVLRKWKKKSNNVFHGLTSGDL